MEQKLLLSWFSRLRWSAFLGQLLVLLLAVEVFNLTLPWQQILLTMFLIPITNLLFKSPIFKNLSEAALVGVFLIFDTILLTVVLSLAGGPTNPFTIVFLLHVVLAAIMLTTFWTWLIAVLSSICFSALFIFSRNVPEWEHHGAQHGFSLHLHGMLVAYFLVVILVAYFLNKLVSELREKERKLERLENIASSQQKLAALTTITANVAHELGTPLSTIAVVSHEMQRALLKSNASQDIIDDIVLLKEEVNKCKGIIQELSEKTGDLIGEVPQSIAVKELIALAIETLDKKIKLNISGELDEVLHQVPKKALTLALRAIIKNAIEATANISKIVTIKALTRENCFQFEVSDQGAGMDNNTLERVGEPFFTTKNENHGMGLGLYLSKLTMEQIGGSISISSIPNNGTVVSMILPV